MINLGRLEEIKDIRSVWPDEAHDFTPWLSLLLKVEGLYYRDYIVSGSFSLCLPA